MTSICEIKCRPEFDAFDAQLAMDAVANTEEGTSQTVERNVESMFFSDLNEDSFMPMNVLAMVELSDCSIICGGLSAEDIQLGGKYEFTTDAETEQQKQLRLSQQQNRDSCMAVAGLPANNTVAVMKYCVPKAQGQSVRSAPTETWFVWFSEEWSQTLVSLHFADTVSGNVLVSLRDNHGQTLDSGHVLEDIVSLHSRAVQADASFYDRFYGDKKLRLSRFAYTHTTKMDVSGMSSKKDVPLKIAEIFVIPSDETFRAGTMWLLMTYIVAPVSSGKADSLRNSLRRDVCAMVDVDSFMQNLGEQSFSPETCNLHSFFDVMRQSGIVSTVLTSSSPYAVQLLMAPTSRQALVDACILTLNMDGTSIVDVQSKVCFNTPEEFVTGASFPTRSSWVDMQRSMFVGVSEVRGGSAMTSAGMIVNAPRRPVIAQNSLSWLDLSKLQAQTITMFATSETASSSHWLRQIRIAVHPDDDKLSVSAQSMYSAKVKITVTKYRTCNRMSCLGCSTAALQALCYAAQQCSIVKCIGTVVNQNRPLCNIGLVMASYAESSLLMMMGAWSIFAETYSKILDAALIGPSNTLQASLFCFFIHLFCILCIYIMLKYTHITGLR